MVEKRWKIRQKLTQQQGKAAARVGREEGFGSIFGCLLG